MAPLFLFFGGRGNKRLDNKFSFISYIESNSFIGLLVSIVSAIIVLSYIDEIELIGPNLAVVLLPLLYSVLIKISVEVLRVRE